MNYIRELQTYDATRPQLLFAITHTYLLNKRIQTSCDARGREIWNAIWKYF